MQLYHQNLVNLEKCLNLFIKTFDDSMKRMNKTIDVQFNSGKKQKIIFGEAFIILLSNRKLLLI